MIYSGKTSGFIAGADIQSFGEWRSLSEGIHFVQQGHRVLDKIAALNFPTVAMIDGFCLGGGLELSLACQYRVADEGEKTKLGLPEVLLGIHPGWGGTVRLPRLMGMMNAFDMMLTGRSVSAKTAKKMGLIDYAVPKRHLKNAAKYVILNKPPLKQMTRREKILNQAWLRPWVAQYMYNKLKTKANEEHYPAPFAIIDNWKKMGVDDPTAFNQEVTSLENVLKTDSAKNLLRIYYLQEDLKAASKQNATSVRHVHVIGAGIMGGDIAAWCALRGIKVTLQDREAKYLSSAMQRSAKLFHGKLKSAAAIQAATDRLSADIQGVGIEQADVIIEAIFEDQEAKQKLLAHIEARAKPDALIASNTSSFPLHIIAEKMQAPQRLAGIHFFNPVSKMPLVEVVRDKNTLQGSLDKALAFVKQLERLPLPVISQSGFLVNRVLMPYLMESLLMVEEGVPLAVIDQAATRFGMLSGPIELADSVGLDICLSVAQNFSKYYHVSVPEQLQQLVERGQLGRKTNKGLYRYQKGKAVKPALPAGYQVPNDLTDRLILRLVNESVACLREGVVSSMDQVDAGLIFGAGFAPFRGGPMSYAKAQGFSQVQERLQQLQAQYGDRFTPDKEWERLSGL